MAVNGKLRKLRASFGRLTHRGMAYPSLGLPRGYRSRATCSDGRIHNSGILGVTRRQSTYLKIVPRSVARIRPGASRGEDGKLRRVIVHDVRPIID